ncbi:thioesterase, FlK family [Aureliella helgolandensis]|uniref:Putative enoyl-CoA hydratase echA8 n=1 Tax=Aureliella helgolandensis TaxID=2527968 RepID=A0A518GA72_9BACT|nr:enoyl-CoA hydratase-related protein [Aureliella helgolandensis]QDV25484.1 putative enoyl-CoA hydratase echA8 [Aureliella helgolandensis]
MKSGLTVGATGRLTWSVDASMVITLGGDSRATVFSTPNMIMLMERAAREALRDYLEPGEESVGIEVNIRHTGGAPLGATVQGIAKVTVRDGRRVEFDVEAWAGDQQIGHGTHSRAIVQVSRIIENLEKQAGQEPRAMNLTPNTDALPVLETVLVELSGKVATVKLNRPKALNAVNVQMTDDLERLVAWLLGHPQQVRVVLLTGTGEAFCAGDDVKELRELPPDTARQLSLRQAELYLAFERVPQTIIALINGDAFGGGCVAAYSADMRIATHAARFAMPEIRLGWPPGYGVAQLTALVGKSRALEMCLLGEPIPAAKALEWGLINEVVPGASLHRRGELLAQKLLQMPAEALRETKRLVHLDEGAQPKVAHRADTEAYLRCLKLPDAQEGLLAFAEKRSPRFDGR